MNHSPEPPGNPRNRTRTLAACAAALLAAALLAAPAAAPEPPPGNSAPTAAKGPEAANGDWWSEAQRRIRESEYHITWQTGTKLAGVEAAWQAPNRAHGLRSYFTEAEVRVIPRTEQTPSWEWKLSLAGYGRGAAVHPVEPPVLTPEEKHMDYDRESLVEWYVNDRRGLEQGFTLHVSPEEVPEGPGGARGARAAAAGEEHAPAYLVLRLETDLTPTLSADGQAIDFHGAGAMPVLHYGGLAVRDATARQLPAWMEMFPVAGARGIRLVFDDREAVYPVTVDPLLSSFAWSAEGNQEGYPHDYAPGNIKYGGNFGDAVAGAGDVNGDGFADVIVGFPWFDGGQDLEGKAFVYLGSPSGLSPTPAWTAESNQEDATYGISVACAGNINGDGCCDDDADGACDRECDPLLSQDCTPSVFCPAGVWHDYDDVIVGSGLYDNPHTNEGMAFVYHGSATGLDSLGNGTCPAGADWCAAAGRAESDFGYSAAGAGDVNGDGFDDVIIGAPYWDNPATNEGGAFVYHGSEQGLKSCAAAVCLATEADFSYEINSTNALLGWSVSGAGNVNGDGYDDVVIAAPDYIALPLGSGRFDVFHGSSSGLVYSLNVIGDLLSGLAKSVAGAGDLDGNGYDDIVVGSPFYPGDSRGRISVYYGSATGLQELTPTHLDPPLDDDGVVQAYARFGYSVAGAGDVNGDGYDDLIVGVPYFDDPSCAGGPQYDCDVGRVYVYHGSPGGAGLSPSWIQKRYQGYGRFGKSVAGAGNVNGDDYDDVIIGAPFYDGDKLDEGAAYVYHGGPDLTAGAMAQALEDVAEYVQGTPTFEVVSKSTPATTVPPEQAAAAADYGSNPKSILISTGLAQEGGLGNTDWNLDGEADVARFQVTLAVPPWAETLRFTTQMISSEVPCRPFYWATDWTCRDPWASEDRPLNDSIRITYDYAQGAGPQEMFLVKVLDFSLGDTNPPASLAVSVQGKSTVEMTFEIRDFNGDAAGDGSYDSALVLSRMFFSDRELPPEESIGVCTGGSNNGEVCETLADCPDQGTGTACTPQYFGNPAPRDVSLSAGTYSFSRELFSVPGKGMPFRFVIRYNSGAGAGGALGPKWSHSYEASTYKMPLEDLLVRPGSGVAEYFHKDPNATTGYCAGNSTITCYSPHNFDPVCSFGPFGTAGWCVPFTYDYVPKFPSTFSTVTEDPAGPFTYVSKDQTTYYFAEPVPESDPDLYGLTTITDANGNEIRLFYDSAKKLDYVLDTRDKIFVFNYDSQGRLVAVEYPEGGVGWPTVTFQYEAADGYLSSFTDRNGYVTSFTYDDAGNIISATNEGEPEPPFGDEITFHRIDYEEFVGIGVEQIGNRVTSRRNPEDLTSDPGSVFSYEKEQHTAGDRLGGAIVTDYDLKERVMERRTFLGRDASGDTCPVAPDADPANYPQCWAVSSFVYDADNNPIEATDPLLSTLLMEYDGSGNAVGCQDADGPSIEMEYDLHNNLLFRAVAPVTLEDCPSGGCYGYTYDSSDNLTFETDELGQQIAYDYLVESPGLLESITDRRGTAAGAVPANHRTLFAYTPEGYLSSVKGPPLDPDAPDPEVTRPEMTYTYDDLGRRTSVTDPRGNTSSYAYDRGGRLLSETNALGSSTSYAYDSAGRMLSMVLPATPWDPEGAEYRYDYTSTSQLERITNPAGEEVSYVYDDEDRLVEEVIHMGDGTSLRTSYSYDAAGRLVGVTDPEGGAVSVYYDAAGNLRQIKDPNDDVTSIERDLLGRPTRESDASGFDVSTAYNQRGLVASVLSSEDSLIEYLYDDAGQLLEIQLDSGLHTIAHKDGAGLSQLDGNGNRLETRYTRFEGPGEAPILRTYDAFDRLTARTDHFGNTIGYEYDPAGNLRALTYSDGQTVHYGYNALNRLVSVCAWGCVPSLCDPDVPNLSACTATYQYDAVGNLTRADLPDGSTVLYRYDAANRLTGIRDCPPSGCGSGPTYEELFTLDEAGRRIATQETLPLTPTLAEGVEDFGTHEAGNQLALPGYEYDLDGNLTRGLFGGSDTSLRYNELNQLDGIDADRNGEYETTFRYDSDGLRVEATRSGTSRRYVYDVRGATLLEEHRWDGAQWVLEARYVHGLGLLAGDLSGQIRTFHYDARGSTVALTDPDGAITDVYAYDPYGAPAGYEDRSPGDPAAPNPFRYNGRDGVLDDDNSLYFMRTRYYAPELMRFLQRDQFFSGDLRDTQSLNRYAFVRGDPIRNVDPNGDSPFDLLFSAVGVVQYVGALALSDIATGEFSGWEAYVGAAAGGVVWGETLLHTGNPATAYAAGNATESLVTRGLQDLTGKRQWDTEGALKEAAVSAVIGYAGGKIFGNGVTKGMKGCLLNAVRPGLGSYTFALKSTLSRAGFQTGYRYAKPWLSGLFSDGPSGPSEEGATWTPFLSPHSVASPGAGRCGTMLQAQQGGAR